MSGGVSLSPATGEGNLFCLGFLNIIMVSLCILDGIFYCFCLNLLRTQNGTDKHANTPPLSFLQDGCPPCRLANSVKALKG